MSDQPTVSSETHKRIRDSVATAPDVVPVRKTANPVVEVKPSKESVAKDSAASFREQELLAGRTTRIVDGITIQESPRVVFEHVTAADDERPIKRSERSSQQIAQDTLTGTAVGISAVPGQRCERHGTPDCDPCRSLAESHRIVKCKPMAKKRKAPINRQEVKTVIVAKLGQTDVERLREDWGLKESAMEKKRRQAAAAVEDIEKSRSQNRKPQLHVVQNIRKEYGYDARKLAKFLMLPGFNEAKISVAYMNASASKKISRYREEIIRGTRRRFPKTLPDLETLLPPKFETMFSDDRIRFYRDSISGNYTNADMQERVKARLYKMFIDDDTFLELENTIIRRAWDLKLLATERATGVDDFERDLQASHEAQAKSGKAADTVVTGGFKASPGKTFQPSRMNSFERGPVHGCGPAGDGDAADSGGATSEDSYDEESGA